MWDDGTIWAGARQGRLPIRACGECGTLCHPPLPMCPECQSLAWEPREACGRATLESWLVTSDGAQPGDAPRIVAVVILEEGVRFVSNVIQAPLETLREGMPLQLCFGEVEGKVLPLFRPVSA